MIGGAGGGSNGLTTGCEDFPDLPDLRLGRTGAEDILSTVGTEGVAWLRI